jgi:hypothetical protein
MKPGYGTICTVYVEGSTAGLFGLILQAPQDRRDKYAVYVRGIVQQIGRSKVHRLAHYKIRRRAGYLSRGGAKVCVFEVVALRFRKCNARPEQITVKIGDAPGEVPPGADYTELYKAVFDIWIGRGWRNDARADQGESDDSNGNDADAVAA